MKLTIIIAKRGRSSYVRLGWSTKGLQKKVPFEMGLERQMSICQVETGRGDLQGKGTMSTKVVVGESARTSRALSVVGKWAQRSNGRNG